MKEGWLAVSSFKVTNAYLLIIRNGQNIKMSCDKFELLTFWISLDFDFYLDHISSMSISKKILITAVQISTHNY